MGFVFVFARTSALSAAMLAMSALAGSPRAQTPDISGTYWATEYHAKIQLVGGGELPLTAGRDRGTARATLGWVGGVSFDAPRQCPGALG